MKKSIFFLTSLLSTSLVLSEGFFDLEEFGYEQYQDAYVNGKVVKKASGYERFENQRYEIVNSVFRKYSRPFSVLDIGAAQGYFSFRGAKEYPNSVFVMLEGSNPSYPMISEQLSSLCDLNSEVDNVIWLNRSIDPADLKKISSCEHFDVILLLNILHWFPSDWQRIIESCNKMAHVVIIEVPPLEEGSLPEEQIQVRSGIHQYLCKRASQKINGVPRHRSPHLNTTYYICENDKEFYLEKTTLLHPAYGDRKHSIRCNYDSKKLFKCDVIPPYIEYNSNWIPGINLLTFLMMNGSWPTRSSIIKFLPYDNTHMDWMPNNMVLSGNKLNLIDKNDKKNEKNGIAGASEYSSNLKKLIEDFILSTENKSQSTVEEKFWEFIDKR